MPELTLVGDPVPKGRPRCGPNGVYTDHRTKTAEEEWGWQWKKAIGGDPLDGDLVVTLAFHVRSKRGPDLDNLVKLVLDGLNKIAWHDDHQIRALTAMVERGSSTPRTWLLVRPMMAQKIPCCKEEGTTLRPPPRPTTEAVGGFESRILEGMARDNVG